MMAEVILLSYSFQNDSTNLPHTNEFIPVILVYTRPSLLCMDHKHLIIGLIRGLYLINFCIY